MANKILKPTGDKGWKHCVKGSIIVTEKSLAVQNADKIFSLVKKSNHQSINQYNIFPLVKKSLVKIGVYDKLTRHMVQI